MKPSFLLALTATLLLVAGCTTTSFAGLAKSTYVDEVSAGGQATQEELGELERQVQEMQELTDQLEIVIQAMEETRAATAELQELARQVELRLDALPRESLRLLVESIQAYLDE